MIGFLEKAKKQPVTGVSMSNTYVAKTDEALSIVDQVKLLGQTFADDKQSGVDEENRLQATFDGLMTEKRGVLGDLTTQRDTQQGQLNQVTQELGENQGALATAQQSLVDEQAYLNTIGEQNTNTLDLYERRKHDRADEKTAVNEALKVLSGSSFLQKDVAVKKQIRSHVEDLKKQQKRQPIMMTC